MDEKIRLSQNRYYCFCSSRVLRLKMVFLYSAGFIVLQRSFSFNTLVESCHLFRIWEIKVSSASLLRRKNFENGGSTLKTHQTLGADPGFFLGGGAPLRNAVSNTDKPHFFCRIRVVLESRRSSQGGVRTPYTLPLDPPLHTTLKKFENATISGHLDLNLRKTRSL